MAEHYNLTNMYHLQDDVLNELSRTLNHPNYLSFELGDNELIPHGFELLSGSREDKKKKAKEITDASREVYSLVQQKDFRRYICPALQSASGDVFDLAKIITPILVPLALAGTIVIPISSVFFAATAIVISRMGVAGLCADYKANQQEKGEKK